MQYYMKFHFYLITYFYISIEIHDATAAYPFVGRCLQHSVVKDFNVTRYSGIWYEINKYFSFADYGLSCISYRYRSRSRTRKTSNETVEYMDFIKKGINKSRVVGRTSMEAGKIMFSSSKKNMARMETIYKPINFGKRTGQIENGGRREAYWILATDYDTFSVVWSCEHAGIMNFQNVVVLARERDPSMYTKGRAYGAMQRRGLSTKLLVSTDQEDCPNLV